MLVNGGRFQTETLLVACAPRFRQHRAVFLERARDTRSGTMSSDARLSIVLGTCNRLASLRRCLDSIVAQTRTPFVVHVTDAGSTDGTQDYLTSIAGETLRPVLAGRRLG